MLLAGTGAAKRRARRRGKTRIAVGVPAGTPTGGYRALVCADDRGAVREGDEGDNCRDAGPVTVVADGVETRVDALSDAFPVADEEDDLAAITRTSAGMCGASTRRRSSRSRRSAR